MKLTVQFNKKKDLLSPLFFYLSVLLLILSVCSIGEAWFHAVKDGWVPEEWGNWPGNHGPWRHYYPGGNLIWRAIHLQLLSFFNEAISMLLKRTRRGIWLILISILIFFVTMDIHYWLVD